LDQRRIRLEEVVACSELIFPVHRLAPDGHEAWKQVVERGYEGYVAKDEASTYTAGPTKRWHEAGIHPHLRTAASIDQARN
jgi:ATP-dependent DNA ligase